MIGRPPGRRNMSDPAWQRATQQLEGLRNHEKGFWVAEANPQAAHHAVTHRIPLEQVARVVSMTDGASAGVDTYHTPPTWREALELIETAPQSYLQYVHQIEASDPHGTRWPRTKTHDDKTLVVATF